MRVLWMACYHLRQHLCISYASVVGMLAYWFCICCFHLQAYVIMPDERRNIDLELKVGLWICLSSYGMTSISSFKIKCSKFFRCLPNNESFFCWSLRIKYNLHTSQMYIWIIKAQHEESKSTGSGLNNESISYRNTTYRKHGRHPRL